VTPPVLTAAHAEYMHDYEPDAMDVLKARDEYDRWGRHSPYRDTSRDKVEEE